MDPNANNYGPQATCDDGSCTYNYNCVEIPGSGVSAEYINSSLGEFPMIKGVNPCIMDASGEQVPYYNGQTDKCSDAVDVGTGPFDSSKEMLTYLTTESSWTSNLFNGTDITQYRLSYDLAAGYNPDCPVCSVPPAPPGVLNTVAANPIRITWTFLYNWATLIPNSTQVTSGNYAFKHYTNLQELYSDIDILLLANTIALNDSSGNAITTVGSFTNSGPTTGTLTSEEINDAFAISPYSYAPTSSSPQLPPNITMDFALCQCNEVQNTQCECQEMFDGTGIYPTLIDCTSALTCCNDSPPELPWLCSFTGLTDSCSNLEIFTSVLSFPNDDAAINAWTTSPQHVANTQIALYKYMHIGNTGTCPVTGFPVTSYWKRFNYIELTKYDTNTNSFQTLGGVGISGWSWNVLLAVMAQLGMDGLTVDPISGVQLPNSAGMGYSQVKSVIDNFNGPGQQLAGVQLHYVVSDCECDYVDCNCIQDPLGTYATENECSANCCGDGNPGNVDIPGCTQESAANYNPGATIDNGSCYACFPAPSNFNIVGSIGVIDYTVDTTLSSDPSAYNVADGTVVVNPTTLINNIPVAGSLQNYVATLYSATTGQASPIVSNQTFQNSIEFTNLEADAYYVIFHHVDYPECVHEVKVILANALPQIKYKCVPGDLVDSTEDLIFVNALHPDLQNSISAFANDNAFIDAMTTLALGQELQTMWGFVAGSTDINKCYSALWGGTKKVFGTLKVVDGDSIIYESQAGVNAAWIDYQALAIFAINISVAGVYINEPKAYTLGYTAFNTYLATIKTGLRVIIDVIDAQCTASATQCLPDDNGPYNTISECLESALCPTSISGTNMGCNQVANANPTNVLTGQNTATTFYPNNDHCLWCSNFNAAVVPYPAENQFGFDKSGKLVVNASYSPIQADNPVNLTIQVRSVTADTPPTTQGFLIYSDYDPAVDKLYPGNYFVTLIDQGNLLSGGTSSSPVCVSTSKILIGGDADAKLDGAGLPTVEWGNDLGAPQNNFIPDTAISIDNTNNTIFFNLNPVNGTYSIGLLDSSGSPADIPQTGVTQYVTNTLPADTYMAIITVDAGNANAGAKATIRNIVIT